MADRLSVSERLGADAFRSDKTSHLRLVSDELCRACTLKPCIPVCPAKVYEWDADQNRLLIHYENCLETGACRVACHQLGNRSLIWTYPDAGHGVQYRLG